MIVLFLLSALGNTRSEVHWFIFNGGKSPLRNIKIKYTYYLPPEYHYLPEIDFLPSGGKYNLVTDEGQGINELNYTFYILYNNGKYLEVQFHGLRTTPPSLWENLKGIYYDRNNKEIKPKISHHDSLRINNVRNL